MNPEVTNEVNPEVTNPFLSKRVLKVVESRAPRITKPQQASWPEARLRHDGKVRVERRADLDQSELTVRHAKQSTAPQLIPHPLLLHAQYSPVYTIQPVVKRV